MKHYNVRESVHPVMPFNCVGLASPAVLHLPGANASLSLTTVFLQLLTQKGKNTNSAHKRKTEQILHVVPGQSTALDLYSPETFTVKDLKGVEHFPFSACRAATGNWCVEISPVAGVQLEKTHWARSAIQLEGERRSCLIITSSRGTRKMLLVGQMCDGAIRGPP